MLFADSLGDWADGDRSDESVAAMVNVCDVLVMAHKWLEAQFEKK